MGKKCIVCDKEAEYKIKNSFDYYCEDCAKENFADLNMLLGVEEEARLLKASLKEKMGELLEKEEELDKMIIIKEKKNASDD